MTFAALQHTKPALNHSSDAQPKPKCEELHVFYAAAQQYATNKLVDDCIGSVANYDHSPRAQPT
jgi:hypothetical protein